jgi:hypothetical protein
VVLSGMALTPDAHAVSEQLYRRNNLDGSYRLLTPEAQPDVGLPLPYSLASSFGSVVGGHSQDFSQIAYDLAFPQSADPVAPNTYNSYEWVEGQGTRLIGVLPDSECGSPPCLPEAGSRLGGGGSPGVSTVIDRSVSRDGNRIYFHAIEPGSSPINSIAGQIYVRENGVSTKRISSSQRTIPDPAGPLPALFLTAESDHGSKALFASCEKLTDDSTADSTDENCVSGEAFIQGVGSALPEGRDLYLFDADSGELTDLTIADPTGGDFFGFVGASDDLARIYFVAGGVLAAGASPEEPNLYLWEAGQVSHIATLTKDPGRPNIPGESGHPIISELSPSDRSNWSVISAGIGGPIATTRTSSDGRHLLFTSRAQLTGYDNTNPAACPPLVVGEGSGEEVDWNPSGRCSEVYLYDAAADGITCVSCNPGGGPPQGDASLHSPGLSWPAAEPPRNLSAGAERVFFQTQSSLVAGDGNNRIDVYEWTEDGVALLSSGRSARHSLFYDATPSGDDAYFTTYQRLAASDLDDNADVYDARVGGGFPEPIRPGACSGEGCQPSLSPPPARSVPGTTVAGAGNVKKPPKRCGKGKVRKKGRCVAKKQRGTKGGKRVAVIQGASK